MHPTTPASGARARALLPSLAVVPALALFFALAALPPAAAAAPEPGGAAPVLEDVFTVSAPGDVQLAPDGGQVLYTLRASDLDGNRNRTHVWMVPAAGDARPVQMTRGSRDDTRPRWRPDGRAFAFLSARPDRDGERSEGAALYVMLLGGGEPERVYGHSSGVGAYEWSPDGRHIAFTATDEETAAEKEAKRTGRDVRFEGERGRFTHLWLLDLGTREARRLTTGDDFTVQGFAWSPDGDRLAFRGAVSPVATESWEGATYTVAVSDPEPSPVRISPVAATGGTPTWTPDGQHVVYTGRFEPGYHLGHARVLRVPATGGDPVDLSPDLDVAPSGFTFTPDGRGAFFEAVTGTTTGLFYMPVDTRRAVRLTPDAGVHRGSSFSADGRRVAFVHESPERPAEVVTARLPARPGAAAIRAPTTLTAHNDHARAWAVGRTEVVRWRSTDGMEIEGLVVHPAGWSAGAGPRALVTKIHGGPAGVFLQSFQASSSNANAQVFAADGYATFLPNPRGSTGYGDAVQRAVIEDWGGMDFQDIVTGVDALIERGIAHPDSLGVMGWSYGGYMTAWAVTQTTRFRAAIVGAGITENISMWGAQDIPHTFEAYFGGGPYEDGRWEVYQRSSPLVGVRNVRTPVLLIHGENDARVPANQALIYFRALRALDVPSELLWLPRTPHGPREPGLQYETARWQKEWMDRWIRGAAATTRAELDGGEAQ
jgi:dipeptidyl aminopeptidase/acylaminoacyl peptidase